VRTFVPWGLLGVVGWSVLALGAVEPVGYSVMELGISLLVILFLVRQMWHGDHGFRIVWGIIPLLCWVCIQMVPMRPAFLEPLSPARLSGLNASIGPWFPSHWVPITIDTHATKLGLIRLLAYVSAFVLAAFAARRSTSVKVLLSGLIVLGLLESGFGIFQNLVGYQKIFSYTRQFYLSDATGTYINKNDFSGLLEMIVPLTVGLMYGLYRRKVRMDDPRRMTGGNRTSMAFSAQAAFFSFVGVLMLVGILFSHSRMGIITIAFTLIFMALLGQVKLRNRAWALSTLLILGCAVGYATWAGLNPILARFEALKGPTGISTEGRTDLWRRGLQCVNDYPVTGTGLGTFELAFRHYQHTQVWGLIDHAHNDYLEVGVELGVVGFVLFWLPILWVWGRMALAFLSDWARGQRGILLGCIGSMLALLIHSAADFNLQIPANALVFAVIAGIGYEASRRPVNPDDYSRPPSGAYRASI
jgi:O-antigen ligase